MTRELSPLERMYPARCYDCLATLPSHDDFLCATCKQMYADDQRRRRDQ